MRTEEAAEGLGGWGAGAKEPLNSEPGNQDPTVVMGLGGGGVKVGGWVREGQGVRRVGLGKYGGGGAP